MAIHSGSRNDPYGLPGLAHFVEHMLFKGTERRRAWHILNRMEVVGGELNAYTTKEHTFVYAISPRRDLRRAMELLADILFHSTFPSHEIERERVVVADEINLYKDTPSDMIYDDFDELFFVDPALAHPILGTPESLSRMTTELCRSYMLHAMRPSNLVLFCMGQLSPERFVSLTERYFGSEEMLADEPILSDGEGRRVPDTFRFNEVKETDTYQTHTLLGGRAPGMHGELRRESALLLNHLAGPGMNTLLNVALREKKGWVYSVEGEVSTLEDIGWWQIYFGSDPTNADAALTLTLKTLGELRENGMSERTLKAWVKQIKGQLALSAENAESRFLSFGKQMLHFGEFVDLPGMYERLDRITTESVKEAAELLFDPENINTYIYRQKCKRR